MFVDSPKKAVKVWLTFSRFVYINEKAEADSLITFRIIIREGGDTGMFFINTSRGWIYSHSLSFARVSYIIFFNNKIIVIRWYR